MMSQQPVTGSERWWQEKQRAGIPHIVPLHNGTCQVTFWWRDPAGDEQHSRVKRLWIYITGVTDHHQQAPPCSLTRIPGTDAWHWQITLSASWRGSYCLIPSENECDFPSSAFLPQPDGTALRQGWRHLLPQSVGDPFNALCWRGGRGHATCGLHLPAAPAQPGWDDPADDFPPARCIEWHSTRLASRRRIWLFATGQTSAENRPLAILLDGQFWAKNMPVWPALHRQTGKGLLPPALYVLIDAVDNQRRSEELPCNVNFWLAVQEELLPLLRQETRWRESASTTVVAGQSFGGLSALYAGLHWPHAFGCVLSQSGSFWWPHRHHAGNPVQFVSELTAGIIGQTPLRIYLEAGIREPLIHQTHCRLLPVLRQTGHQVFSRQTDGGHDALCWRGGLIDGLMLLWSAQ